ncbi:head morphogenesis protein [Listeria phage P70]|uniref:Head morphogenesis protein n=1 Tax=Listeria phage P70 TaxID=1225800 RepID=J9QIV7_9CAUD|nr:head morphogenesis [Listeria phage P70]AFQ96198.1 head morphogenesis protein [Listeria phage P70]
MAKVTPQKEAQYANMMFDAMSQIEEVDGELSVDLQRVLDEVLTYLSKAYDENGEVNNNYINSFEGMQAFYLINRLLQNIVIKYQNDVKISQDDAIRKIFRKMRQNWYQAVSMGEEKLSNTLDSFENKAVDHSNKLNVIIAALIITITRLLHRSLSQGYSEEEAREEALKAFSQAEYQAKREIRTSTAKAVNQSIYDEGTANSVMYYQYTTAPELSKNAPCKHCRQLENGGINGDGIYDKDSVPVIPVHPFCRCTIVPVYSM